MENGARHPYFVALFETAKAVHSSLDLDEVLRELVRNSAEALGVKAAHPGKPVVCITGDGGFMFAAQELATAAQEEIALVTLVFNNNAYGNVLRDQKIGFANRVIGAVLRNPDFRMLAEAFRITAYRVTTPEGLRPVLATALQATVPVLIEIEVPQGSEANPWEFIHPKR